MQQNEINLNQMFCMNPHHQMKEISFLCLNSTCNNESRLVCMDCYHQHPQHRVLDNKLLYEDIQKNISTESPLAKETLLLFQQLKGKIIGLLNQIEQELVRVCQMRIPNESAEELLNFLKYPQFDRNYLNFKVENYIKTTTGDQLYNQNSQRNLSTIQLEKFSTQITSYIVKINNWLLKMPLIEFKPFTQQALQKKFSEDFGNAYYNQLKPEKFLIQQFSVKQPTRLNAIKHGRIEGLNEQLIQFHFYMGTQLDCPFYKYSVRIQQMVIVQNIQNNPNEFITKFDPPIYLFPKVKYCISISSSQEFPILDFSQRPLDNSNQNFSLHILSHINELVFKQRYFVTEFIYDIMEIQ